MSTIVICVISDDHFVQQLGLARSIGMCVILFAGYYTQRTTVILQTGKVSFLSCFFYIWISVNTISNKNGVSRVQLITRTDIITFANVFIACIGSVILIQWILFVESKAVRIGYLLDRKFVSGGISICCR